LESGRSPLYCLLLLYEVDFRVVTFSQPRCSWQAVKTSNGHNFINKKPRATTWALRGRVLTIEKLSPCRENKHKSCCRGTKKPNTPGLEGNLVEMGIHPHAQPEISEQGILLFPPSSASLPHPRHQAILAGPHCRAAHDSHASSSLNRRRWDERVEQILEHARNNCVSSHLHARWVVVGLGPHSFNDHTVFALRGVQRSGLAKYQLKASNTTPVPRLGNVTA